MTGLMMKSDPLNAEQAKVLHELVSNSPIPRGSMALAVLQLLVSLERIMTGQDNVVPVTQNHDS